MRTNITVLIAAFLLTASMGWAADSPTFRGPDRDGHFAGNGLLKAWPEGGPTLLWKTEGLGESYASMSIVGNRIYTSSKRDMDASVIALDTKGNKLWEQTFGKTHPGNGFPGTRTTPTYSDDHLYVMSSTGEAVCLKAEDGSIVWTVNLFERFGNGKTEKELNLYFGASESPLVLGNKVIFTPGAPGATMVALNKKNGETIWATEGLTDKSAYCSPRLFKNGGNTQIITMVEKSMIGVDPENGKLIWSFDYPVEYGIHAVSPVFKDNMIYVSDGYKQGGKMVKLAADGKSVSLGWEEKKMDVHHGGLVLLGDRIYGASSKKDWYCLDLKTGEILAQIDNIGKGTMVTADGLLYGYVENGDVMLVNPDPANFSVISKFRVKEGSGKHWSHPVIASGVLYIRHGDVLLAYDVKG